MHPYIFSPAWGKASFRRGLTPSTLQAWDQGHGLSRNDQVTLNHAELATGQSDQSPVSEPQSARL